MTDETKEAFRYLQKRNVLGLGDGEWAMKLMEYLTHQGEEALQALAGFHVWTLANIDGKDQQETLLVSTFSHDINGMKGGWMDPRSSNYLEFWTNRNLQL